MASKVINLGINVTYSEKGPSVTQPPPPPDAMILGVRPGWGTPLYVGSYSPFPPKLDALPLSKGEWIGSSE